MAVDIKFYKVPKELALRAGVLAIRYRTKDGMFLLDNKDLARVRMTSEEMEHGFKDIVRVTADECKQLQVENGFKMGLDGVENDKPNGANEPNGQMNLNDNDNDNSEGEPQSEEEEQVNENENQEAEAESEETSEGEPQNTDEEAAGEEPENAGDADKAGDPEEKADANENEEEKTEE